MTEKPVLWFVKGKDPSQPLSPVFWKWRNEGIWNGPFDTEQLAKEDAERDWYLRYQNLTEG